MTTYHLYLDETGSFEPGDLSAIGGICAPTSLSRAEAETWWAEVLGHPRVEPFHANEFAGDLSALLLRAIDAWRARGCTPVILEHVTRGQIVDNATTYVHVFADGITKVARTMAGAAGTPMQLALLCANRRVPDAPGSDRKVPMPYSLYESRLHERIAIEALRGPVRLRDPKWTYSLGFASATEDPRLMMADLACYAWRGGKKFRPEALAAYKSFLEGHRYKSLQSDDDERIRSLLAQGAHGPALLEVAASLTGSTTHRPWQLDLRDTLVGELAELDGATRDAALEVLMGRLRHEVEVRRDFDLATRLLQTWHKHLLPQLETGLAQAGRQEIAWAAAQARGLELALANHRGAVAEAERILAALTPARDQLAGRFERLPLALHIRILEAVHRTNTYDFELAHTQMAGLASTLDSLLALMADLAPGASLDALRSDLLGRVLGTGLQAATMASRRNPAMYEAARSLSDLALTEFASLSDRQRQAGYRAQLETDAGQLDEARNYLALAMGLEPGAPLDTMAQTAGRSPFWAMHLARYWAAVARAGSAGEAAALRAAFLAAGLDELPAWSTGQHPAHVYFWKSGVALAALKDQARARRCLDRAIRMAEDPPAGLTVRTIGLAAQLDRLGLLLGSGDGNALRSARKTLDGTLKALLDDGSPAAMRHYFEKWPQAIEVALGKGDRAALTELSDKVPY
jgi:tetratricopeptide (TPR) repeat protein